MHDHEAAAVLTDVVKTLHAVTRSLVSVEQALACLLVPMEDRSGGYS